MEKSRERKKFKYPPPPHRHRNHHHSYLGGKKKNFLIHYSSLLSVHAPFGFDNVTSRFIFRGCYNESEKERKKEWKKNDLKILISRLRSFTDLWTTIVCCALTNKPSKDSKTWKYCNYIIFIYRVLICINIM